MRSLLTALLFLIFIGDGFAQERSAYQPRDAKYSSYTNAEDFKVTFKKSNYGLTFKTNDPALDNDLKERITRFMRKNHNRQEYQGNGEFTLRIVKRNQCFYVMHKESPEKLLEF
ncbi:MAG TPA: hypothetical protein VK021_10290 [Flavobacteriaceae bacterium]|nr:hypothetical protein [Flavobacteriaceae bacterium]